MRRVRYPAILALVSAVILIAGLALKPAKTETPQPTIPDYEMQRLQQLAERRSLEDMSGAFARIASGAATNLLFLREANTGAILWDRRQAVIPTPAQAPDQTLHLSGPAGASIPVSVAAGYGPVTAVTLASPAENVVPATLRRSLPAQGAWVLQVSRDAAGSFFTPGIFRGLSSARCGEKEYATVDTSIGLTERMNGGGLFDLDGRLFAILTRCEEREIALWTAKIAFDPAAAPGPVDALMRSWGLRLTPLDDDAREYFRTTSGLMLAELRDHSPAESAGLQAGDVLLDANGADLNSESDLANVHDNEAAALTVLRAGRKQKLRLSPASRDPGDSTADFGIVLQPPPEGIPVRSVLPDSTAAAAGIRTGDRLLSIDGVPAARLAAGALSASSSRRRLVILHRGDATLGILVP